MGATPKTDTLIEGYRSYAHAIAAEVLRKMPSSIERDDLEGAAELGLVEAANAFDPTRGVQFKTFAYYRIRGAVYDALRKMAWMSRTDYQNYRFQAAANEYMQDYSSAAPPAGSADAELGELQNLTGAVANCYLLSLEGMTQELADKTSESVEDRIGREQECGKLRNALTKLPERNRKILEAYYFQNQSLEEIGETMGLSKSWVCRMHAKSLEMMRDLMPA